MTTAPTQSPDALPADRELFEAMPDMPEPDIESTQMDSVMRVTTIRTHSDGQIRAYGDACAKAVLAADRARRVVPVAQPVAWMRRDGMKAMPADERAAWIEAGSPELVEEYTTPLYASPPTHHERECADTGARECGHPESLMLHSAETGQPLYCEACDDKSGRRDAEQMEVELTLRVQTLTAALRELVSLKDMKERLNELGFGADYADYRHRKPLAWDAARAALVAAPPPAQEPSRQGAAPEPILAAIARLRECEFKSGMHRSPEKSDEAEEAAAELQAAIAADRAHTISLLEDRAAFNLNVATKEVARAMSAAPQEQQRQGLTEPAARALHAAVAAVYFRDSSDYLGALWSVARALDPYCAELLDSNDEAALTRSQTLLAELGEQKP